MTAGRRSLLLGLVTFITLGTMPLVHPPGLHADACNPEAPPGNYGLDLDGQSSRVDLGAAAGLGGSAFTLEAWILRHGAGLAAGTGGVLAVPILAKGRDEAGSEGNNLDLNWFLGVRAGDGVLVADFEDEVTGANHPVAGATALALNTWYHVAATYDGATWNLYLNGNLETTLVAGATPRADSVQHAAIGAALDSTGAAEGWFDGVVDEARVWNVARTASEIQAGMSGPIAPTTGLLGRWDFDAGIGPIVEDRSGGGHDGTLTAGVYVGGTPFVPGVDPILDHALDFDGAASHVTFGAAPELGLSTFTLEAWFNRRGAGVTASTGAGGVEAIPLVTKGRDQSDGDATDLNWFLGIRGSDGVLVADFEDNATGGNHPVIGVTPIVPGRWNHAAAVFDGVSWRLYLNGALEVQTAAAFAPRSDSADHAGLGTALDASGAAAGFLDGQMDEVRIWSVPRSSAEIADGMKREIAGGAGLLARWGLGEASGTTVADAVHAAIPAGSLVGTAWVDGYPFDSRLVFLDDTCDGIDQDCDGVADDGYVAMACGTIDVGVCQFGASSCVSGSISCGGSIDPSLEACNGLDDDCDGSTDEGLGTLRCGAGVCANEVPVCSGGVPQTCAPGSPEVSRGVSFDGVDDRVDFGNHASITGFGAGSFTVEEWFRVDDAGPFAGIFRAGRQGANPQVVIQTPGSAPFNRLTVSVEDAAQHQVDTVPVSINFGQWYHVAAVVDRGVNQIRVYLDGALATAADASIWGGNPINPGPDATIVGAARLPDGSLGFFLHGSVDELRLWNVARTAQQIQEGRFQQIASGASLLARWGFGEGSPAVQALDSVSGGARNTGILNGGVNWIADTALGTEGSCDGLDNDCDGAIDENYAPAPTTCGLGVCASAGVTSCVAGGVHDSCHPGTPAGSDGVCNLLDDDCDGAVDEDFVGAPVSCGVGACGATGQTACVQGQISDFCEPGRSPSNYGVDLDGESSYVTFGHAPTLGLATFTVEAWFKRHGLGLPPDTGQQGLSDATPIVARGRGEADGSPVDMNYFLGVAMTDGRLQADFEDMATGANHPIVGVTSTVPEVWYHAAMTYDGDSFRIYLNGNLEVAHTENGAVPRLDSIQHFAIGSALNSTGVPVGWFDGVIDEVRVWGVARSQAEIQSTMGIPVTSGPNLVGRWGLDETSGNTVHDSVGSVHGIMTHGSFVTGTPFVTQASPIVDHAIKLNGRTAYVAVGPTPALGLSTFTVETWFNRKGISDTTGTGSGGITAIPLVTKGRGESDGDDRDVNYFLGLREGDNRLLADFEDTAGGVNHPLQSVHAAPPGAWNHAALTYDGSTMRLYLNGALEAEQVVNRTPRFDSIEHVAIGSALTSTGSPQGFFEGEMNEARIWNYARTGSEIRSTMKQQMASAPGLVGRWPMTESSGTTVVDTAGAPANDGTLVNGTRADGYPFTDIPSVSDDTCDAIDDDCDGSVDEDLGNLSCGVGACAATVPACVNGQAQTCTPGAPVAELCDAIDNDCDGTVDNGFTLGAVCTNGVGACQASGVTVCDAAQTGTTCNATPGAPVAELCDAIDNDCDGAVDNGFTLGAVCTVGVGACQAAGVSVCDATQTGTTCNATPGTPVAELCDAIDNDCDGTVDNGFTLGAVCTVGVGACQAAGVSVCDATQTGTTCNATPGTPAAELCDAIDNDCDGSVDNGFTLGAVCTVGVGACQAAGVSVCDATQTGTTCNATPGAPVAELCDAIDNDCDGTVDNGFTLGAVCTVGVGACQAAGVTVCDATHTGTTCNATPGTPAAELCDAIDNDCDGSVDNGFTLGAVCTVGVGACQAAGVTICDAAQTGTTCNATPGAPVAELCDAIDNDCDGTVDNGFTLGAVCTVGVGACQAAGVTVCDATHTGTTCNATPGTPAAELCDAIDNDCDGSVDNGFTLGAVCTVGVGACQAAGVTICDAAQTGTTCNATPGAPVAELCDAIDNDCDGTVDNGFTLGAVCTVGVGACQAAGVTVCDATQTGTTCNATPGAPVAELCDAIDNDCDGTVDNGFTLGAVCTNGVGACQAAGVTICDAGQTGTTCNATPGTSVTELCDAIDNDCDGTVDNGFSLGAACTNGVGACQAAGVTVCDAGQTGTTCNATAIAPVPEVCDGVDNDCNGAVDNGFSLGAACTDGVGACQAAGITVCDAAQTGTTCNATPGTPVAELCDGVDNDCDGSVDNGFSLGAACTDGVGACQAAGVTVCDVAQTGTTCNATPGTPVAELCDGVDNDCNGAVDNGFTLGAACTDGVGACQAAGVTICDAAQTGTTCNATPGTPVAELCDGVDNDCNGAVDNGFTLGAACTSGIGACQAAGVTICDVAQTGTTCNATPGTSVTELCDAIDNDCDGTVDNGFTLGAACTNGIGACQAPGVTICDAGQTGTTCNATPGGPVTEMCDGVDNDCNGAVDNGFTLGAACTNGVGACQAAGVTICDVAQTGTTCNATASAPVPEVCDGIDNDCDGTVDNGFSLGAACTNGVGACQAPGVTICDAGQTGTTCNATPGTSVTELCDAIDNDCDGTVDNGFTLGAACTNGVGACQAPGVTICDVAQTGTTCNATPGTPVAELCDGVDNDCNGAVDNGFTLGAACTNGVGACQAAGVTICDVGQTGTTCNATAIAPVPEVCDGVDNDCNGAVDNGFSLGAACTDGVGACQAAGITVCDAAQTGTTCNATPGTPVAELCDGVDNDCDGSVDNGFSLGAACTDGVGACQAAGVTVCDVAQTGTTCNATPGTPVAELCDGVDNDCNGAVDNGFTLGAACTDGVGACQAAGVTICDAAQTGTTCNATPGTPVAELCDGVDNDCNGAVDNGFTLGAACTSGIGACQAAGVTICDAGQTGTTCNATPGGPVAELCDGVDNDCNGAVDNGFSLGAACTSGIGACQAAGVTICDAAQTGTTCNATPGSPAAELCDGLDNDCDASTDEDLGVVTCGVGACAAAVEACTNGVPGLCTGGAPTSEVCDLVDNDCDGVVDDGAQPAEATNLILGSQSTLNWSAAPGAVSQSLYRGSFDGVTPWTYNEVCLQSNLASPTAVDNDLPPVGSIFFYFAVGQNACGAGSLGAASDNQTRPAPPACP